MATEVVVVVETVDGAVGVVEIGAVGVDVVGVDVIGIEVEVAEIEAGIEVVI